MFRLRVIAPVIVMAVFVLSLPAAAQIAASSHDFSGQSWAVNGEICNVCHTPHDADTSVTGAPLWDHDVSANSGYTLYTSDTLDATLGQPDHHSSRLCLSCHDGTVAKDAFGSNPNAPADFMTSADDGFIGLDLRGEHPIEFTYDTALATTDGGLHDPAVATTELGGTIANDLLFGGIMGCASCHDVHNAAPPSGTGGHMLRIDNAGSDFCLTCHDK